MSIHVGGRIPPVSAAAGLHRAPGLVAGDAVRRHSVVLHLGVDQLVSVRIVPREVQQVDAREDDQEATEQRDRVHGFGGVEALEEDEGGTQRGGGESDIVQRVHAVPIH